MARTTDNLGLTIPDVGEPPEQWVQEISDTFDAIDNHDHTTGQKITQEALDLRGAVTLHGNPLNAAASVQMQPQETPPLGAGRLYADSAGNLTFRTAADIPIQITSSAGVAGAGGNIGGDYAAAGASLTYDSASKTYRLLDQTGSPAALLVGNAATTQISLGDTSPSTMRTLSTVGGDLYYRDASNRTYPLTNNGHAVGGDIRGDYQTTTANVSYTNSTKKYLFTAPGAAAATVQASKVQAVAYNYVNDAFVTRRLYASPISLGPFLAYANDMVVISLPVPRGSLGSVLYAVGAVFTVMSGSPSVFVDVAWWATNSNMYGSTTVSTQSAASGLYTVQGAIPGTPSLGSDAYVAARVRNGPSAAININGLWADYGVGEADAWAT